MWNLGWSWVFRKMTLEARSERGVGIYKANGEVGADEILGTSWVKVLRREGTSV